VIVCDQIVLTAEKAKELRNWLDRPGLNILLDVAASQVKYHEALALNNAVEAKKRPLKGTISETEIEEAFRYATFIDVLNEFAHAQEFKTTKLT
jgi:hypothetical protein